jgi:hypothetical protein
LIESLNNHSSNSNKEKENEYNYVIKTGRHQRSQHPNQMSFHSLYSDEELAVAAIEDFIEFFLKVSHEIKFEVHYVDDDGVELIDSETEKLIFDGTGYIQKQWTLISYDVEDYIVIQLIAVQLKG